MEVLVPNRGGSTIFCKKVILLFLSYATHTTENNLMNSIAYDIPPVKLCRYQSLPNFEHNTVIKLHHMNKHKVCVLTNKNVNDCIHLYIHHGQRKTEHGHKTLKYDVRMS
jgi:hypothetical protein